LQFDTPVPQFVQHSGDVRPALIKVLLSGDLGLDEVDPASGLDLRKSIGRTGRVGSLGLVAQSLDDRATVERETVVAKELGFVRDLVHFVGLSSMGGRHPPEPILGVC
jgi:hypothetical protein